jgi:DNA-binding protein HU-beta
VNKGELISAIAEKSGVKKGECENVLNAFIDSVVSSLKKEEEVRLVGFGTFSVSHREAMIGRNPSTGQEISIPACRVPKFKPGQVLKDSLNSK